MGSCLLSEQGIDTPAPIDPDIDSVLIEKLNYLDHVTRGHLISYIFHLLKLLRSQLADPGSPNISSAGDSSPLRPQDEIHVSHKNGSPNRRPSRFQSRSASVHLLSVPEGGRSRRLFFFLSFSHRHGESTPRLLYPVSPWLQ